MSLTADRSSVSAKERRAGSCRWATPTLFLPAPYWFSADGCPWTCLKEEPPRVLTSTEECHECPHWEPRSEAEGPSLAESGSEGAPTPGDLV